MVNERRVETGRVVKSRVATVNGRVVRTVMVNERRVETGRVVKSRVAMVNGRVVGRKPRGRMICWKVMQM